jgi:predicted acylesterase/phospholipase RssA
MCSTAIPGTFPPQKLYYKDNSNSSVAIKNRKEIDAEFVDGGLGNLLVFSDYIEFFQAYGEKFDKIYFISPDFAQTEEEAVQRISLAKRGDALEEKKLAIDPLLVMDFWTNNFLKSIKAYNSGGRLADEIYYCKPELERFNPLDFSNEKQQYDATITWGKNNPDKIAIDINSITL